jgi:hypothetical protein
MSVLVRFGRRKAILRLGRWISADRRTEAMLNDATTAWVKETGGPPLEHPQQERVAAEEIASRFGGRILLKLNPTSRRAARVWVQHRQLRLF